MRDDYPLRDVPLAELVRAELPAVRPQFEARDIALAVDVPNGYVVRADPEAARRLIGRLLANAARFTPEGGDVLVATAERDAVPEFVFLRVCDTGPGIADHALEGVFLPEPPGAARDAAARGEAPMDLPACRAVARAMGGDLRARSVAGLGSTLSVAFLRAGR